MGKSGKWNEEKTKRKGELIPEPLHGLVYRNTPEQKADEETAQLSLSTARISVVNKYTDCGMN